MQLEKAYAYLDQFPWLAKYFEKLLQPTGMGTLAHVLRNTTRYIAVRPIENLDLASTQTFHYNFRVPKPQIGAEKPVDLMAFCITSPMVFQLSKPIGKQEVREVENASVATESVLTYSGDATLCYRFQRHPPSDYHFEYLPSTHSIRDAITAHCEKYGHVTRPEGWKNDTDIIEPQAIVVSRMLWSETHFEIFRTFDIYAPASHQSWHGMKRFCGSKKHKH